jgi:asparagine synthase (glutamine-hydrolysing)
VDASLIGRRLDTLYDFLDEPFGDQTSLLNWAISQKAKEFVTVVLSGDGADELFWGYPRYEQWKHASLQLPFSISLQGRLANLVGPKLPGNYWSAKADLELEPNPLHRHFTLFLSPVLKQLTEDPIWQQPIWAMQGADGLAKQEDAVAWWDLKTYLADAMLHKVDRASMAASLEVRVPYLDNKVVDYALALPWNEKSNGQYRFKSVLKHLLLQLSPNYPINRPKKGFNFPLDRWLRLGWRERVFSLVDQDAIRSVGLDDRTYLPMVKRYYEGDRRYCIVVWYLLNLALWYQKFKRIEPLRPA